jgi:acyl dehydratase/putative sterol carrier protein
MALNMNAIGKPIGPMQKEYTWKDAVLYALGVGAGFAELDYCFEKNLKVIPSFAIAVIFDFLSQATIDSGINLAGLLHGEQELIFHHPIPPQGTLTTTGKITDYYDKGKGKGALIIFESETVHDNGQRLFTSIVTLFGRLDGGFGGQDRKTPPVAFPDREPDFVVEQTPSPDQPLLYRLSGDIFHLHVDPEFANWAGFDKPIMHGLCTHGFACRALIASLVPGHPERVRRLTCRFSKTLYPGEPIRTLIWKTAEGKALWRTINAANDQVVIDNGELEYGDIPPHETCFDNRVAIVTGPGKVLAGFTTAAQVFAAMPGAFSAKAAAGLEVVFQYLIPGAGEWYCEVRSGVCNVSAGRHERPRCTLEVAEDDFLKMINGTLPPMEAYTSGKLKISGDIMKAQLIGQVFRFEQGRKKREIKA